jgi:fluoride ion exporter CrcB/FEX
MRSTQKKGAQAYQKPSSPEEPVPEKAPSRMEKFISIILTLSGIAIGAILGAYIRVGITYYRIWRTDANYCVLFAQIIGSFIMGLIVSHKRHLHDNAENRLVKAFYISVSSGLCGSITTFSSWQLESNKNFFL